MRAVSLRGHKYLCWVILVLAIGSSTASAATVLRASRGGCDISLEGPIAVGDKSTLTSILAQLEPQKNVWLCLHSPGGNYNEALGIIETMLAVEKGIATRVEANRECLSACALVFLAGNRGKSKDDELQPARELDAKGVLGFHGPYVKPGPLPPDPTIPAEAFRAGLRAIGRLLQISSEKMFPSDLLIGALEKGPSEFLYVDTIAKTGEWSVDFVGYRKPANLTARMLQVACTNNTN